MDDGAICNLGNQTEVEDIVLNDIILEEHNMNIIWGLVIMF